MGTRNVGHRREPSVARAAATKDGERSSVCNSLSRHRCTATVDAFPFRRCDNVADHRQSMGLPTQSIPSGAEPHTRMDEQSFVLNKLESIFL
ncbi:unnamed protein product [Heligmosomoides polygyrus]|uniref:Uncharacterized protein n=1 Tax=Heligmosomoides polygyrus TaxID=6339 RepID=A0A183F3A3_HELPZ|nr:unnamed protein product [Heligmosomoides polygyrus]